MDCLFCRIAAGEVPSHQIYSDGAAVALLDIQPWHRGHTLVIPRRHVADLLEQPPALTEIAPAVEATSRLLMDRLGADGLNLLVNTGAVSGQEVFHLHVHLIPRYSDRPGMRRLMDRDPRAGEDLDALHDQISRGG